METRPLLFLSSKQQTDESTMAMAMAMGTPHYDSTAATTNQRGGLATTAKSASGRGKLRFTQRQQMKLKQKIMLQTPQTPAVASVGIYNSIFSSKRNIIANNNKTNISAAASAAQTTTLTDPQHSQLYTILNPKSKTSHARLFQTTIASIIILDAIIYIISTEPKLQQTNYYPTLFYSIEGITSTIFLVELLARLVVCTEKKCYGKYGPIGGRWRYMCSFQSMIDSLATLPFFIELCTGIDLPTFR